MLTLRVECRVSLQIMLQINLENEPPSNEIGVTFVLDVAYYTHAQCILRDEFKRRSVRLNSTHTLL